MTVEVVWVRYSWNLRGRIFPSPMPAGYELRMCEAGELGHVTGIVIGAYASDPIWKPMLPSINRRMTQRIADTFCSPASAFFCGTVGEEPIAVTGVSETHWTRQQFLTGICVLPDHQRRGVGTALLAASLTWLRDRGLRSAHVFTEQGSIADLKMYPRFGSKRIVGVEYPDPPKVET